MPPAPLTGKQAPWKMQGSLLPAAPQVHFHSQKCDLVSGIPVNKLSTVNFSNSSETSCWPYFCFLTQVADKSRPHPHPWDLVACPFSLVS